MEFSFLSLLKEAFIFGSLSCITAIIISPLQFIKIIRQQTGDNYKNIIKANYKKSGIKIFYRGAYPYGQLQFLSSFAFGLSEFICIFFLKQYNLESSFTGILIRSISAGIFETAFTVKAEVQEISKNKGDLMKRKGTITSILEAIFMRNTLFWMASLLSFYFIQKIHLTHFAGSLLAFVFGVVFGVITIPLDLVATQNCGDDEIHSVFSRIKKILNANGQYSSMYYGSIARIMIISIFTIITTIIEMILR
jgi:hypothetical protein